VTVAVKDEQSVRVRELPEGLAGGDGGGGLRGRTRSFGGDALQKGGKSQGKPRERERDHAPDEARQVEGVSEEEEETMLGDKKTGVERGKLSN